MFESLRIDTYHYNYECMHSGCGMVGRMPYKCRVALGFGEAVYAGLMPVMLFNCIVL